MGGADGKPVGGHVCECEDGREPVELEGTLLCLQTGCIYGVPGHVEPDDGHGH